ncbi:MAG: GTP cyclohydrolase I FolE2 [Deltaproteobacteria bacterium]|nr:GTP cyclohydrolase I FolE2 [Candidatus Anaeroferrophillus wilburensis]MBN2889317.1 GTP cyclohydrolase I FolE2 [Deltaproteobacteria bacterium]
MIQDIQQQLDHRQIEINKVGVKGIQYPIQVLDKTVGIQHTIGDFNMYVSLPHHFKGTHMSRFVEVLNKYHNKIGINIFPTILKEIKDHLEAESAHLEISFPYFIDKEAPVSRAKSKMIYQCTFSGNMTHDQLDFRVLVKVPVTSLCPCSKAISEYGAHNQRSMVSVNFSFKQFVWIEDMIKLIEETASCDIYPLLKRPDEKYVTERAYTHPMFVEDLVREIATLLLLDQNITWFTVEAENMESIHNHSAYAYVEKYL